MVYVFDHDRKGLLLTGGDKKGKNERQFYKDSDKRGGTGLRRLS